MKSIRLLPVVIAATLALLVFKGVGLLTGEGYVLGGGNVVLAASGPAKPAGEPGQETTVSLPEEPTLADASPTLEDGAPTMSAPAAPAAHAPAAVSADAHAIADIGHGDASTDHGPTVVAEPATDPRAEGVPMFQSGDGVVTPLAPANGSFTEAAILERLSARRAELDAREQELAMRLQLLEAAEARLAERTAALAEMEARIEGLVQQQQSADGSQFVAITKMYEQMKPAEAALIFNDLDMQVLLKVAQGMNPRKMSAILARMSSARAQQLTLALAAVDPAVPSAPTVPGEQNLAALPQIVGQ